MDLPPSSNEARNNKPDQVSRTMEETITLLEDLARIADITNQKHGKLKLYFMWNMILQGYWRQKWNPQQKRNYPSEQ